jgi:aldehyde decarbonylase
LPLLIGRTEKLDFVFLAHGTELLSSFHLPNGLASFAAHPYEAHWYLWPLWALAVVAMVWFWVFGKVFTADKYKFDKVNMQTWVIPRYGFQVCI